MLGAIAGDIIGSRFEFAAAKTKDFALFTDECTFTDDTVLSVALAENLLDGRPFTDLLKEYFQLYPDAGYGGSFLRWARSDDAQPYNSFGNGSAMRVSPVGWYFNDLDTILGAARRSAEVTHSHPEGVKGAQAVAMAIFLARQGEGKEAIKKEVEGRFAYDLSRSLDAIRPSYRFDVTCQGSVPEALIAFLEADDFEDAVRNAVSLGGDSDTQACISGAVAEAFFGGVPAGIQEQVWARLDDRLERIVRRFIDEVKLGG